MGGVRGTLADTSVAAAAAALSQLQASSLQLGPAAAPLQGYMEHLRLPDSQPLCAPCRVRLPPAAAPAAGWVLRAAAPPPMGRLTGGPKRWQTCFEKTVSRICRGPWIPRSTCKRWQCMAGGSCLQQGRGRGRRCHALLRWHPLLRLAPAQPPQWAPCCCTSTAIGQQQRMWLGVCQAVRWRAAVQPPRRWLLACQRCRRRRRRRSSARQARLQGHQCQLKLRLGIWEAAALAARAASSAAAAREGVVSCELASHPCQ